MAVLGGVVFADDEVGDVWCQVIFVNAAQVLDFGGDLGLETGVRTGDFYLEGAAMY